MSRNLLKKSWQCIRSSHLGVRYFVVLLLVFLVLLNVFFQWSQGPIAMAQAIGIGDETTAQRIFSERVLPWSEPKIHWLGHATMLLEWESQRILLDPYFGNFCTLAPRRWVLPCDPKNLGTIDMVILSHAHRDHFDPSSLDKIPHIVKLLIPRGTRLWLGELKHVDEVLEVSPEQQVTMGRLKLTAIQMDHGGHRQHPLKNSPYPSLGYMFQDSLHCIFWAGDTGVQMPLQDLKRRFHPDAAILPIGSYLPSWPVGRAHLNPHQALDWAAELGLEWVMPSHFGTFRLAWDKTDEALPWFLKEASERKINVALAKALPTMNMNP